MTQLEQKINDGSTDFEQANYTEVVFSDDVYMNNEEVRFREDGLMERHYDGMPMIGIVLYDYEVVDIEAEDENLDDTDKDILVQWAEEFLVGEGYAEWAEIRSAREVVLEDSEGKYHIELELEEIVRLA